MALNRSKFGYLSYDDMFNRLADGQLDQYDICYIKDTGECYIISENLIPRPIKSKVNCYSSVSEAEIELNESEHTYEGQVISIKYKEHYRAYMVEKSNNGTFVVVPIDECQDVIDYDKLGNRPIVNLVGSYSSPIVLSELEEGSYYVRGEYVICRNDQNVKCSMRDTLFLIGGDGSIKKLSSKEIVDYTVTSNGYSENRTVTESMLESKNYATMNYVDGKINQTLNSSLAIDNDIRNLFIGG